MDKIYIYLSREKALQGIAQVLGTGIERIENYEKYFEGKAIEYHSNNIPTFITYDLDSDTIREATPQELYERGKYILGSNEYLKNGVIKEIPQMPTDMIVGEFDEDTETWKEMATLEEKIENLERIILSKTSELNLYKDSGFQGSMKYENLKKEIEILKIDHVNLQHELALEMNNK